MKNLEQTSILPSQTKPSSQKYIPLSSFTGQVIVSHLYSVYFTSWLVGFFGGMIFGSLIYSLLTGEKTGGPGSIENFVVSAAMVGILTGITQIVMVENKANNEKLNLAGPGKISIKKGLVVILSVFSIYLLIDNIITFAFKYYLGPASIIKPESAYPLTTLDYLDFATNFSSAQSPKIIFFIVLGYFLYFISVEYLLRGLIGGNFRRWRSGAGPAIIVPAVLQVLMFQIEIAQLAMGTYYYYIMILAFLEGLLAGIIFWITKKLWTPILFVLMVHGLPRGEKFHTALMRLIPQTLGVYDPIAPPVTFPDKLDQYIQTLLLLLMFVSFIIPFVYSKQTWNLIVETYESTKAQWKGMLSIIIVVTVINYVIYLMFRNATSIASIVVTFILVAIIASFIASFIFNLFHSKPSPELIMLYQIPEKTEEELIVEPEKDVKAFLNTPTIFEQPYKFASITTFIFLYGSFLAASYRNIYGLKIIQAIILSIKIWILPAILIWVFSYFLSKQLYLNQQFDNSSFQTMKKIRLFVLFLIVLYSIIYSSLGEFHPRIIAYFAIIFPIYPSAKDLKEKVIEALSKTHRYRTIIYMTRENKETISKICDEWKNDRIPLESREILFAWKGWNKELDEETIKQYYEEHEKEEQYYYGIALAIGLGQYPLTELLFKFLRAKSRKIRYVAFWAIGRVGRKAIVPKLARAIEREHDYELREMATRILLKLDPNYPLMRFSEEGEDELPAEELVEIQE